MLFVQVLHRLGTVSLFGVVFKSMLPLFALMTGNDGDLTLATVSQPVRQWSLNEESGERETTNATDAATTRSFLADRAGATFEAQIYADDATEEQAVGGAALAVELIAKQGTTDKKWAFSGIVLTSRKECNIAGGDAVLLSVTGRVTGAITKTQFTV